MATSESYDRLSRISTLWSVVDQAHRGASGPASAAQRMFLERYCGAVYRYLFATVKNEHDAMDLFQEFAVKFLRGDFQRADPLKGRFRDYLKVSLVHLINDFRRRQRAAPDRLPEQMAAPPENIVEHAEDEFIASWKDELFQRVWDALRNNNESYYTALLFHVQNPDAQAMEIANHISGTLARAISPGNVRVLLHRARQRFGSLLRDEIAQTLGDGTQPDAVDAELRELGFASLCESKPLE